ncbi:MAG: 2-phospho-L-lactate guanylyltransferase [Frankiales bacterium]|nr:MAG: 2-phospho-L-lactate guanylyltransferase [Frankiales bacterium]
MPGVQEASWGVVVPVKRLAIAKSRLAGYGERSRQDLALAFACDVVSAALDCPLVVEVLVVTDDHVAAAALTGLGASVAPDDPDDGLNPALSHGAELLRAQRPGLGVVTVSSDLPALRPEDLATALGAVRAGGRAFVADSAGTGTTLLAASAPAALAPSYGPGSRDRHAASGALQLQGTPALRRDVDTPEDLREALALGVGARTAAACAGLPVLR